ncbi:DNA polymerase Y family protein [Corallococcus sp. H22C18031201]|uniref:Y-family DNA polymerase n=1 Tax=Citreicoccus inhibens TaxID=2849499 RepID=UPI000E74ED27|nr:DNA polymerase Y family protein [Citreicoccus inhibens]MBU8894570.1 DNA polymerase Y family protein [Citreicoccus inhibens]RJS25161.1 DNA polymerase Y family protein [Corallococcus sp. H22C18031201]
MRRGYLHLVRFPVQRKVVESPELAGRPFVLVEEARGQRRVAFASTSALRAGARPGLTLTAACALEPALGNFPYRPEAETAALAALGEALLGLSPGFQLSAPEGLWFDASAAHLVGGEEALGSRVLEVCAEQGYRGHVAVASESFTARALARHGARRVEVVAEGQSGRALSPLSLSALESREAEAFSALGLSTLGQVAALPPAAVTARGGAAGARIQARCRGADDTPFVPAVLEEVLEERVVLDGPVESFEPLQFALKTLLDRLGARLSGRGWAAVKLTFLLKLDPSGCLELPLTLARPTARAKLLLDLARHRLSELRVEHPVVEVAARVDEHGEDSGQQLSLGEVPEGDAALEVVLSRLVTTLGDESLFSSALEAAFRPEAAHLPRRFQPPEARRGLGMDLGRPVESALGRDPVAWERPPRLLAQPACLEAELSSSGGMQAAWLNGRRHGVTMMEGPERLDGEWWSEAAFSRDYYRVFFEGLGPAWVFRDARDGRYYLQGLFD